jgi:sulfite exporter TauE/SafE
MNASALTAFGVGVMSALHCIGMCGGIVGALSFSVPPDRRAGPLRLLPFLLAYNLGRIASYAAAGALLGWLGASLVADGTRVWLAEGLRIAAALALVGIGLYLGGWMSRLASLERLGVPLWRRLEPLGRRLLPVRSLFRAALLGVVWGWLPCGLVYGMLIGSPAQGGAMAGAFYMGLFGAGTLPVLLAAGLLAGRLYRLAQDRRFQAVAGATTILTGLLTLTTQGYNG